MSRYHVSLFCLYCISFW